MKTVTTIFQARDGTSYARIDGVTYSVNYRSHGPRRRVDGGWLVDGVVTEIRWDIDERYCSAPERKAVVALQGGAS